jgi:predicted acylesterase/phospholipase RssA
MQAFPLEGLYHMGVVKALLENNLLPRVISGSSAGALFAAILGAYSCRAG